MPGKYIFRINDSKFSFIITPKAFYDFLEHNDLETKIRHILGAVHLNNKDSVKLPAEAIKKLILNAEIPKTLASEILFEYKKFGGILEGSEVHVSLLKDGETHKVKGDSALLHKTKEMWTFLFTPHPSVGNPSIVVSVNSPVIKKITQFRKFEQKLEREFGSIIHNSQYVSK